MGIEAVREAVRPRRRCGEAGSEAALRVVERHGASVMRTARRFSASSEDAEDAYQRAVEILLKKAPDIPEAELVPWLKTVAKHEAFAIRRGRDRMALGTEESFDGDALGEDRAAPAIEEQVERAERLRLGAEAMRHLKPQEIRCLVLKAEGYSYKQICDETGWTYTKVNRCLTEGRQSFLARVAGIESGEECERLAPLLSAIADGEASADDLAAARPHLRSCLACRATVRDYRSAPARVAALVPPLALGLGGHGLAGLGRAVAGVRHWLQGRASSASLKLRGVAQATAVPKAAAVVAVTTVAGSAVAVHAAASPEVGERPAAASAPLAAPAPVQDGGPGMAKILARLEVPARHRHRSRPRTARRHVSDHHRAGAGQPTEASSPASPRAAVSTAPRSSTSTTARPDSSAGTAPRPSTRRTAAPTVPRTRSTAPRTRSSAPSGTGEGEFGP